MPIQLENKASPFLVPKGPEKKEDLLKWGQEINRYLNQFTRQFVSAYNLHLDNTYAHPKGWDVWRLPRPSFTSNGADTSQVLLTASNSLPATFSIGGVLYQATSTLTMDLDTAGVGGLRTGLTKAADTIYYLYAVNNSGAVGLVADTQDPNTGPSGYTTWEYLGAFSTVAASAIAQFTSENGVYFSQHLAGVTVTNATPAASKTIQVPTTAKSVLLRSSWNAVSAIGDNCFVGATSASADIKARATSATAGVCALNFFWVPILTAQTIFANVSVVTADSVTLTPCGWVEYPGDFK